MNNEVTLCLDSESLKHPEVIGLPDENLLAQPWLTLYSDAFEARKSLSIGNTKTLVWVISCDSMEGINLAAALKMDSELLDVCYVTFEQSGSIVGRCEAAGIGVIRGSHEFVKAYTEAKQRFRDPCINNSSEDIELGVLHESQYSDSLSSLNSLDSTRKQNVYAKEAFGPLGLDAQVVGELEKNPNIGIWSSDTCTSDGITQNQKEGLKNNKSSKGPQTNEGKPLQIKSAQETTPLSSLAIEEPLLNLSRFKKASSGKKTAFSLAVVSGSGGSGKSTIALCSALVYQDLGYRTLLLDADLQFGDMAYMLGRDNAISLADVIEEPERIAQVSPEDGLPAVIAAPERLEQSELIVSHMAEIVEFVKGYFDVVVLNTGSFWTEQHAQIIESVDKTLFVIDQRPSSVRACSRALALCSRCGIAIQPFAYALNFCSRHALLTPLDISCAMQGISVQEIKDGGRDVGELLGASLPKELLSTKSAFIQSVRELCISFLPEGDKERFQEQFALEKSQRKTNPFSSLRKRRVACL